ncbi:MAG: DsbA family oxidoreductase [Bryobacterales bacterium]|nr:DsbA family oxidoreductase [Bryobacterales bacterium]
MPSVTIYTDYVCPFCLLGHKVLVDAIAGRDVAIHWRPFELRPEPVPTLRPEGEYLPRAWEQSVYPMARQLGVEMRLPRISPQPRTAKAFELLAMAQDAGLDDAYSVRVLKAFFQEEQDIGDPEVLVKLAAEAGLDAEAARRALAEGTYTARHQEALRHAREEMRIQAVPTFVIGDTIYRGIPPKRALETSLNELLSGEPEPSGA